MIRVLKERVKRHWPRLRLRTILFATLFLVAALPGIGAVFLRVYENTLVRQTEAELVAQGAALAATAQAIWPGAPPMTMPARDAFHPEPPTIDLSETPILPERPAPVATGTAPSPDAVAAYAKLRPISARTRQTTLAAIMLLDGQGRVLTGPDAGRSYAALPEIRAALAGHPETVLRRNGAYHAVYRFEWLSRAAAIRVHYARPVIVNGKVVGVMLLSRSARALFKGLYEDRGKIALGVLTIFAILVVLSGVLSRGISRPIEALARATRSVAAGRGNVPEAPPTAAVEIQALYADFAAMAAAIERRSHYLRDMAHAVSHEFKTPLAGIRGAIELLQDHDATMAPEERRRFLANADADAQRLSLLVTRLLDLARADMAEGMEDATGNVAAVVARLAGSARDHFASVDLDIPDTLPIVAVPDATLEAALSTLLDNSRKAGATAVKITARADKDAVTLCVSDNGPGIAAGDRARIFEPFFTTRRNSGGTGLGLPIIASLLHASGATIALTEAAQGTAFELRLPLRD
ncbi:ATP-binding protein [Stakelama sediminis]|nr:HAMP domain-containing sensor histidine kinase [Stakelama sediminis]